MELRQLRYFLTIVEERHFTRAAERCYVSQPALSQQIQNLEAELETVLLDRSRQGVQVTQAGEILARHARRIFQELQEARVALDELSGLRRGSLIVGVVQTVNAYLMPAIVSGFMSAYPGIRLQVEERSAVEIEFGVLDGSLQVGISFVPAGLKGIEAEPLFSEELVLIVSEDHPLRSRSSIEVNELEDVPLALLSQAFCTRRLWDASAREAGIEPRVLVEMNTIGSLLAAVRRMEAATVLPALTLGSEQARGLTGVPLRHPTPRRTLGLLHRRGRYRCAATRAFIEKARESLALLE